MQSLLFWKSCPDNLFALTVKYIPAFTYCEIHPSLPLGEAIIVRRKLLSTTFKALENPLAAS